MSALASLTEGMDQEIGIELTDFEGNTRTAGYAYFRVANASEQYRINVADYSGNAGEDG